MIGRSLRALSYIVVLAAGAGLVAQTPDRGRAEAEARRVTDRIRALQTEADQLAGEARTLLGDLRKLEVERELQQERVRERMEWLYAYDATKVAV